MFRGEEQEEQEEAERGERRDDRGNEGRKRRRKRTQSPFQNRKTQTARQTGGQSLVARGLIVAKALLLSAVPNREMAAMERRWSHLLDAEGVEAGGWRLNSEAQ